MLSPFGYHHPEQEKTETCARQSQKKQQATSASRALKREQSRRKENRERDEYIGPTNTREREKGFCIAWRGRLRLVLAAEEDTVEALLEPSLCAGRNRFPSAQAPRTVQSRKHDRSWIANGERKNGAPWSPRA